MNSIDEKKHATAPPQGGLDVGRKAVEQIDHVQSQIQGEVGGDNGRRALLECIHQIVTSPRRRDAVDVLARRIAFECPGSVVRIAIGRRRIEQFHDSRLGWLPRGNSIRDAAADDFSETLLNRDLGQRFLIAPTDSKPADLQQANSPFSRSGQAGVEMVGAGGDSPAATDGPTQRLHNDPTAVPGSEGKLAAQADEADGGHTPYVCIDLSPPMENETAGPSGSRSRACVLMMRPQPGQTSFHHPPSWLTDGAGILATALASRPTVSFPRWMDLLGSKPLGTLLVTILIVGGIGMLPVSYPVPCSAIVAPTQSRLVAAPFDATLLSASVTPGDTVRKGQTLLQLDGRPIRIELDSIASEIRATEKDANIALASGKIAEAQRANLNRSKLSHRANLLKSRLEQLTVLAPIDGVVMGSDLRRHLGSPMTVGQTLMEVAPIGRVAIELEIPEFEINMLPRNAESRIRFNAAGGTSHHVALESIDPQSQIRDDRNVFVGRLTMVNHEGRFRPGMKGDATVYGPARPLAWSYLRPWWERLLWSIGY